MAFAVDGGRSLKLNRRDNLLGNLLDDRLGHEIMHHRRSSSEHILGERRAWLEHPSGRYCRRS